MPRRARITLPQVPHHIIQRGNNRSACFYTDDDYYLYLEWLQKYAIEHDCQVHAYVLMTNHVHLLVTPQTYEGLAKLMKSLGQRYVQYINRTYGESVNTLHFIINDNLALTQGPNSTPLRSILGPLADNGGKTKTHALVSNSPAIDTGLHFFTSGELPLLFYNPGCRGETISFVPDDYRPDQRGVVRPVGNECDIGAYEYEPSDDTCYVVKTMNNKAVTFCL